LPRIEQYEIELTVIIKIETVKNIEDIDSP